MHHRSGNQTGGGKDGTSDGGAVAETMGADSRSTQSGKERRWSKQADWGTLKNMLLDGRSTQRKNTVAE